MHKTEQNMTVVLVAMCRYQNFPIRIMHPLLENINGIKPYTIFFKNYDTNVFKVPSKTEEDLFVQQIIDLKPSLVGISVMSPFVPIARKLTKLIKDNSSALVIWGGVHPTISPESSIKEADIICIGEGEGAITDLATHMRDGKDYSKVKNLWINNSGKIIKNSMRPLIQDLDSLPFPSRGNDSFLFINSNRVTKYDSTLSDSHMWIISSRGCPFVCSYCVNSVLRPLYKDLGNFTRRRSVNNIIREIKYNLDLSGHQDYVIFKDEVFGTEESWLNEFESTYKKEIGLPFYVDYTPKFINSTLLNKLVNAGVHTIRFGLETGSDHIRKHVFHRTGKNNEIINIANKIASYGVKPEFDLIMNNPYDTEESLENTIIRVLLQLPKPLSFNLCSLQYFPDYPLTQKAIEDGHIKIEDTSADTLMERTALNWSFTPKLLPIKRKQILQNLIWLVVKNLVKDGHVKYAVLNDSIGAKFCLIYLYMKSIVLGKILGAGGWVWRQTWIGYLINGSKYLLSGDINLFLHKVRKHMLIIRMKTRR